MTDRRFRRNGEIIGVLTVCMCRFLGTKEMNGLNLIHDILSPSAVGGIVYGVKGVIGEMIFSILYRNTLQR